MKLVIPTCDKYSPVIPYNVAAIRRFWPNCPYDVVVVGINRVPPVQDVETVLLGEDLRFGSNMRKFLSRHYSDKALLLWLDDYLLTFADDDLIRKGERLVSGGRAFCVRLSRRFTPRTGKPYIYDDDFVYVPKRGPYSLSLQAAIWDSAILFDILKNGETAWKTETKGSDRIAKKRPQLTALLGVEKEAMQYKNYFRKGEVDVGAHLWAAKNLLGYTPIGKVPDRFKMMVPKEVKAPAETIVGLAKEFGIRLFVETGTYHGDTAEWASYVFDTVYTIEAYESHFKGSQRRLIEYPNIKTLFGDSRSVLRQVLSSLSGPAILWLDAHWLGNAGYAHNHQDECPLREELKAIAQCRQPNIVLIDDARFFVGRPRHAHIDEQWPTLSEIEEILEGYSISVAGKHIICVPEGIREDSHTHV